MNLGRASASLHAVVVPVILLITAHPGFAWGPEGHGVVVILASHYLRPEAAAEVRSLLGPESMEEASLWADQIAHSSRRDTASWHYIDIPLRDSKINLGQDCPNGQCVLVKTEEFLAVLGNPQADPQSRREALKFVIHFMADLHQPLHCEDHHDKGGNTQQVFFEGHPDNLHWVWDTGLVREMNRNPQELASQLGREITASERAAWQQGTVQDWVLESHRVAETAAYRRRWIFGSAVLDRAYDERAEAAIRVQLERAGVRLAYVLNQRLRGGGAS